MHAYQFTKLLVQSISGPTAGFLIWNLGGYPFTQVLFIFVTKLSSPLYPLFSDRNEADTFEFLLFACAATTRVFVYERCVYN